MHLVSKYQRIVYAIAPISSIAFVRLRKHGLTFIRLAVETHPVAVKIDTYELPPDLRQTGEVLC